MSMAERLVFAAIRDELARFTDATNYGRYFKNLLLNEIGLSEDEAETARLYFSGGTASDGTVVDAQPPTLLHGYARQGGPFPCYALTLSNEGTVKSYIGDDASALDEYGEAYMGDDDEPVDAKVQRVSYTYAILVIANNPDVVMYYYHLLKHVLRRRTRYLSHAGLDNLQLNGADMAPDSRYLPSDMFARTLAVSIETDESWDEAVDGGTRGTRVSGIHTDDGNGESGGVGSVTASITPYTE